MKTDSKEWPAFYKNLIMAATIAGIAIGTNVWLTDQIRSSEERVIVRVKELIEHIKSDVKALKSTDIEIWKTLRRR